MRYEPKENDIYEFVKLTGQKTRNKGDEIQFKYCPYCGGGEGKDDWTASINRKTGLFNCMRDSCGKQKNMVTLSQDFGFSLGHEIDEYFKPQKTYHVYKAPKNKTIPKDPAIKYLESRGISKEIAEKYEITVKADDNNILVFPFYDPKREEMSMIKYRRTDYVKGKTKGSKEWFEPNGKPILFGMNQCNYDNKTLIVTEGQMDSLSVAEAGIENAVSVPGGVNNFKWTPYCWNFVNKFDEIIVFGDYEKGHITLVKDFKWRFDQTIKTVRIEDYKDCKDANEILLKYGKEQIRKCIENAESEPLDFVIDFTEIKDVDIFAVEKIKTGIKQLDDMLYGGLPFPGVVLVTGKASEGKSTFASQIMANALDQGYDCFAYSGELPADFFRAWMMMQLAGKNHLFEYKTPNGYQGFNVTKGARDQIDSWVRGRLKVFDNTYIDSNDPIGISTAVEKVIKRHGSRVILLDNLMTALNQETEKGKDKYELQSSFTKKLARIALKYEVLILLVAHKRKNSFGGNEMDDVSGTSDITNLATVVISYTKDKDLPENQRKLKLLKNRLFGKTNMDGWDLDFEDSSRRIYGEGDDVNREYSWNKLASKQDGFTDTDENPFT